jgi:hypothetical protein
MSEQEWLEIFAAWEASKVPQKQYCETQQLDYKVFCQKRSALIRKGLVQSKQVGKSEKTKHSKRRQSSPPPEFIPLWLDQREQGRGPAMIEIALPYGIIVRVPAYAGS